ASLGTALALRRLNPLPGLAATAGIMVLLWEGGTLTLAWERLWIDPVLPWLGVIAAYMFEMALLQVTERRAQQEIRSTFGRIVGGQVMEDLMREDRPPELRGELREITLLFSDLQNFTTLSERMPAPELVAMLNDYFEVMLSIIERHGGTVDKLMGDGIMADFVAPKPHPDHASRAVACALEMQAALERFQRQAAARAWPPLTMRIGLHTGDAVVGLLGSP